MKRKVLLSIVIIGVVGALVGSGVFAYFSDTETSTGNTFTAGTLNLKVGSVDPCTETITVSDTYGGDSGSYDWLLKNDGSIVGSLDVTFSNIVNDDNGLNEPELADPNEDDLDGAGNGELAGAFSVTVYIDENDNNTYDGEPTDTLIYQGFVGDLTDPDEQLSDYAMSANYGSTDNKAVRVEWSIAGSVDNEIQSDIAGFDISFELLQSAD